MKYLYPYLCGRHFKIVIDHRPLKWLKSMKAPNNMFAKWIIEIQSYYFDVIHRPGKLHGNADGLSRCLVRDEVLVMSKKQLISPARRRRICWKVDRFPDQRKTASRRRYGEEHGKRERTLVVGNDGLLYRRFKGKSCKERRQLVVAKKQVGQILMKMHDHILSRHPVFFRTYQKIQQKYLWPKMKSDIKRHLKHCDECQI